MQVNIILAPEMVQLDLTGPFEVLARVPGWRVDLVAASREPVRTDGGLTILPTVTRDSAAPANLLVVPGGEGAFLAMADPAWIAFVRRQAAGAGHVVGVCTGSILLAAAGLLTGRHAGCHWQARDFLAQFGAVPSAERITVDGRFYTSGGVTSGIDMALRVVADLAGRDTAQRIQLQIEYDPAPPFPGGTPAASPPEIVEAVIQASAARRAARARLVAQAAANLRSLS